MTIDVNDLTIGERFWSQVLGMPVLFEAVLGQYSGLGERPRHQVLLQLVPESKSKVKNRVHLDVEVEEMAMAIKAIEELGGRLVAEPDTLPDKQGPAIEYVVMADPFGNEFCLVHDLRPGGPSALRR